MVTFETLIANLQDIYFFSYFMPFVFVLAVTYGIISKLELFEDDAVDATVAIVVAFLSMLGIYTMNLAGSMVYFFGALSVSLVAILGFVIVLGMFGVDVTDLSYKKTWVGISLSIVIAILIIMVNNYIESDVLGVFYGETALTIYMLGGVIAVIYLIVGGD